MNPFDKIAEFLTTDIVGGLLKIATPIAIIALIVCCLGAFIAGDESAKSSFKRGIWFTAVVTVVAFSAQGIIAWIDATF